MVFSVTVDGHTVEVRPDPRSVKRGDKLVWIDVKAWDRAFAKEENFYISPGGGGQIGKRYQAFGEWFKTATWMTASEASVDGDRVGFHNGRHRYAWLRDQGVTQIPVTMSPGSLRAAKRLGLIAEPPKEEEEEPSSGGAPVEAVPAKKAAAAARPSGPVTANEEYRDASLRHQVNLRRYSAGVVKRVSNLLATADVDLADKLRSRLVRFEGKPVDFTGERWKSLLDDVRSARSAALAELRETVRPELQALGPAEAAKELQLLGGAIPIEVSFATVAADQLRAIATSAPFHGKLLRDWFQTLETADRARLNQALQIGMSQGETTDAIVRRVLGTKANRFTDGVLSVTRREATTIVRTAVNHVSNEARGYVWDANSDIILGRVWVSTLDGRTSAICRSRDGLVAASGDRPIPAGLRPLKPERAKPPAHLNCRSTMVALIDGEALIGERPFVVDTRTRDKREIDFREMAKAEGRSIQEVRRHWAARNIGRLPASTTYGEFLKRQSVQFQNEVLGVRKAQLFRQGGLNIQDFVDRSGNELSLAQLAATHPEAFKRAGL